MLVKVSIMFFIYHFLNPTGFVNVLAILVI
jgi:hypothetical protein